MRAYFSVFPVIHFSAVSEKIIFAAGSCSFLGANQQTKEQIDILLGLKTFREQL